MNIQFVKKIQFTRLVKTGGRLREFNFLKYNKEPDGYYCVDTADDRGNRIIFFMYNTGGAWRIEQRNDLPQWITNAEEQFHKIIQEEAE